MEVRSQLHAPAALPPGKTAAGIYCIGGYVAWVVDDNIQMDNWEISFDDRDVSGTGSSVVL
jgi:hypothetical protein